MYDSLIFFQSTPFFIFFLVSSLVYWICGQKYKNLVLLIASYLFVGLFRLEFAWVLFIATLVNYAFGVVGFGVFPPHRHIWVLSTGVIFNLLFLVFFKSGVLGSSESGATTNLNVANTLIPLGISFYTFQCIGYLVDIYRGRAVPERNFLHFSLFLAFFPKFVCGPIERSSFFQDQIKSHKVFSMSAVSLGCCLFFYGIFCKTVLAVNCDGLVNSLFEIEKKSFLVFIVGGFFYFLQVYFDFSGYTNMARGLALCLGFNLSQNFKFPFLSISPSDFWNRWHLSLSSWVKNYIFVPIVTRTRSPFLGIAACFPLMGLWHGFDWIYLVWGLYWLLFSALYQFVLPLSIEGQGLLGKTILIRHVSQVLRVLAMLVISSGGFFIFYFDNSSSFLAATSNLGSGTGNAYEVGKIVWANGAILLLVTSLSIDYVLVCRGGLEWFSKTNIYFQALVYLGMYFVSRSFSSSVPVEFIYSNF